MSMRDWTSGQVAKFEWIGESWCVYAPQGWNTREHSPAKNFLTLKLVVRKFESFRVRDNKYERESV